MTENAGPYTTVAISSETEKLFREQFVELDEKCPIPKNELLRNLGYQRAHVTAYIYQHPELFRLLSVSAAGDYSKHRWTLGTEEDLELLRAIFSKLTDPVAASWREVLEVITREPELAAINSHVRQKALEEG